MLAVKDRLQPRKRLLPKKEQLLLHKGSEPPLIKLKCREREHSQPLLRRDNSKPPRERGLLLSRKREKKLLRRREKPLREGKLPSKRLLLPVLKSLRSRRSSRERLPRRDVKRPRSGLQPRERLLQRGEERQ
jgi:hypothetical protein